MGGEQLAYVATWLASARLVFGDRPKNTTWRRLAAAVDAASADRCYTAANLERYYGELLPQLSQVEGEAERGDQTDVQGHPR